MTTLTSKHTYSCILEVSAFLTWAFMYCSSYARWYVSMYSMHIFVHVRYPCSELSETLRRFSLRIPTNALPAHVSCSVEWGRKSQFRSSLPVNICLLRWVNLYFHSLFVLFENLIWFILIIFSPTFHLNHSQSTYAFLSPKLMSYFFFLKLITLGL